jgi:hypothetical protein
MEGVDRKGVLQIKVYVFEMRSLRLLHIILAPILIY